MEYRPHNPARFWSKIEKRDDGCRIHLGPVGSHGYAQYGSGLAHRIAWLLTHGVIPDGLWVLHRCNVKRCVNPDHLYVGDHRQNMDDVSRGRYHPKRKLSTDEVEAVRSSSEAIRAMARRLGVSQRTIQSVVRGRTYRHG